MSRLRQRSNQGSTSAFLEKFKGKTTHLTKQGLAALFGKDNQSKLEKLEFVSMHDVANKENLRCRPENITDHRRERLQQYALDTHKPHTEQLKLPRIVCSETIEHRERSVDRNAKKTRSEYTKHRLYATRDPSLVTDEFSYRLPTQQTYFNGYGRNY